MKYSKNRQNKPEVLPEHLALAFSSITPALY